ncbi:hypothetical protein BDV25DRAFT_81892 [Aspergillus avenaceus]|uniref:Uncharacterized protein n=1 Tax=Aspergillus avenaceus TaxID=36643 RepID=A0A5N6U828_ASPAV|nr:hypothetical protein BDV25DRAFT_81892 [Aspergillus avenaceus]
MATVVQSSTPAIDFLVGEEPSGRVPTPMSSPSRALPYWLVNVPRDQWPVECPRFLRHTSEKNKGVLATPDAQYKRQEWGLVKELVRTNRIDRFRRLPSDLRKYLEFKERIIHECGSVMRFVVKDRLRWGEGKPEDLQPRGRPFEFDADDLKILYNDWPYGLEKDIVHLVVWTKFALEEDPATDDLTPHARRAIDHYVSHTFCARVPSEKVIWFRNWKSLKSVHAVEHFHVMLYQPDPEFLHEITHGDVPMVTRM